MRLLLDTHVLIWWLEGGKNLTPKLREQIGLPDNEIFISAASAWEIAIKKTSGKLQTPDDLEEQIKHHSFTPLNIELSHALRAGALPLHHRDPFDRMLIAQCQIEDLILATHDTKLSMYDVPLLEV
jgi:PIN domain nuclease of toxin-antitoxin system